MTDDKPKLQAVTDEMVENARPRFHPVYGFTPPSQKEINA